MKDIDLATETALQAGHVPCLMLVELDFPAGMLRFTNAGQNAEWNGHTWYAGGSLIGISDIEESATLEAHGITLTLSPISLAPIPGSPDGLNIVQLARAQDYQGRPASVWLAPLDATTWQPITDPVLAFNARMNKMDYSVGKEASFALNCESRLVDWDRPRMRRYNDADQRARYGGDRGLEYMEQMVEKNLIWGLPLPPAGPPIAPSLGFNQGNVPDHSDAHNVVFNSGGARIGQSQVKYVNVNGYVRQA